MAPTLELEQFLRNANLTRHADKLMDENVVGLKCLDDLKDMSDTDVHDVASAVNMNLMETKRFEKAVHGLGVLFSGATAQNSAIGKTRFSVGDQVQYYSENMRRWYDCTINAVHRKGEVEVSCKPGTLITVAQQVTRLRASGRPQVMRAAGQVHFHIGDKVQYYSETMKRWYDCSVTAVRPSGEVELSCKPGAWIPVAKQTANLRAGGGGFGGGGGQNPKTIAGHSLVHAGMTTVPRPTKTHRVSPLEKAAVKIQATFRGQLARRKLGKLTARPRMAHRSRGGMRQGMTVPTRHHHAPLAAMTHHHQPRHTKTHRASPLEKAAVKIQAAFRGQLARRGMMAGGHGGILGKLAARPSMAHHSRGGMRQGMMVPTRHHAPLAAMTHHHHQPRHIAPHHVSPLEKAAVKIQAAFRGQLARRGMIAAGHGGIGGLLGHAMHGHGHGHAHGGIGGILGRIF